MLETVKHFLRKENNYFQKEKSRNLNKLFTVHIKLQQELNNLIKTDIVLKSYKHNIKITNRFLKKQKSAVEYYFFQYRLKNPALCNWNYFSQVTKMTNKTNTAHLIDITFKHFHHHLCSDNTKNPTKHPLWFWETILYDAPHMFSKVMGCSWNSTPLDFPSSFSCSSICWERSTWWHTGWRTQLTQFFWGAFRTKH